MLLEGLLVAAGHGGVVRWVEGIYSWVKGLLLEGLLMAADTSEI